MRVVYPWDWPRYTKISGTEVVCVCVDGIKHLLFLRNLWFRGEDRVTRRYLYKLQHTVITCASNVCKPHILGSIEKRET